MTTPRPISVLMEDILKMRRPEGENAKDQYQEEKMAQKVEIHHENKC